MAVYMRVQAFEVLLYHYFPEGIGDSNKGY